jgi:hypothetical protein
MGKKIIRWTIVSACLLIIACSKQYFTFFDPVPSSGNVEGKIIDDIDGQPIDSARVDLVAEKEYVSETASTDYAGDFRFRYVSPGDYIITVTKFGYKHLQVKVHASRNSTKRIKIALRNGLD